MAWTINEDVWIERNADGYARLIRHLLYPFREDPVSGNPYQLAVAYLRVVQNLLGITEQQIDHLADTIPPQGDSGEPVQSDLHGPQLRWRQRIEIGRDKTAILTIQQTHDGAGRRADVEGAGLRILIHRRPITGALSITGVTSTLRRDFNLSAAPGLSVVLADVFP